MSLAFRHALNRARAESKRQAESRKAIAQDQDGNYYKYELQGSKIRGQVYHGTTRRPMSDGAFTIAFSWEHGNVNQDNWEDVVEEDIRKRGLRRRM